jgi:hypothetical protein
VIFIPPDGLVWWMGVISATEARGSGVGKQARESPISASSRAARRAWQRRGCGRSACPVWVEEGGDVPLESMDLLHERGQRGEERLPVSTAAAAAQHMLTCRSDFA